MWEFYLHKFDYISPVVKCIKKVFSLFYNCEALLVMRHNYNAKYKLFSLKGTVAVGNQRGIQALPARIDMTDNKKQQYITTSYIPLIYLVFLNNHTSR